MKLNFNITGMTCSACSARVEKLTAAIDGVKKVDVNLLAGTMQVEVENEYCEEKIIIAIQNAGYGASLPGKTGKKDEKKDNMQGI